MPAYDTHSLLIGGDVDYEQPAGGFIGDIDEVRLWSTVRSLEEINADARSCSTGAVPGLRAYWPLDEGMGQTVADVSGAA